MNLPALLVVDDDMRLRQLLKRYLTRNHFRVLGASDASTARTLLSTFSFDLIVMDYMMPGLSGPEFTRELRDHHNTTPILMLTAMGEATHRITGLESGADDYLAKPFEPRELILRIQNLLKRTLKQPPETLSFGSCVFDLKTGALTKSGRGVSLTGSELELLRILSAKAGQILSREELGRLMKTENDRTVDVQIKRLRQKIEEDVSHPLCIQTARGQGYILIPV